MHIPSQFWRPCYLCEANIAMAVTNRMSKGKPVEVPIDVIPASGGTWLVSLFGGKLHAGEPRSNQRAAATEHGQTLHTSHLQTCIHKDDARRRAVARNTPQRKS